MKQQEYLQHGDAIGKLPVPSRQDYSFVGWYTSETGGTIINKDTIVSSDATYYAHWNQNIVAKIGNNSYASLQVAIDTVSENNVPTTITLYKDINESVVILKNQNIVFDLQNFKISNKGNKQVITNNGTVSISNGTIESNVEFAPIDNNNGAKLVITGGNIISTGTRGAVYNKGGIVEISGSAYLSSTASGKPDNLTFDRATINNTEKGKVTITGGTIIGLNQEALNNNVDSTLTIGSKNGTINNSNPTIIGKRYGIINTGIFNYYDGIIKGITGTISGNITDMEVNSERTTGTETIDGDLYQTEYLEITE